MRVEELYDLSGLVSPPSPSRTYRAGRNRLSRRRRRRRRQTLQPYTY